MFSSQKRTQIKCNEAVYKKDMGLLYSLDYLPISPLISLILKPFWVLFDYNREVPFRIFLSHALQIPKTRDRLLQIWT